MSNVRVTFAWAVMAASLTLSGIYWIDAGSPWVRLGIALLAFAPALLSLPWDETPLFSLMLVLPVAQMVAVALPSFHGWALIAVVPLAGIMYKRHQHIAAAYSE
jgi:hypothetical protein